MVTMSLSSDIHARSSGTLLCWVTLTAILPDNTILSITWSKDGHQLQDNNNLLIVSSNSTGMLFRSNVTIPVLDISDSGQYTCQAVLLYKSTHNPISSPTVSILLLEVEGKIRFLDDMESFLTSVDSVRYYNIVIITVYLHTAWYIFSTKVVTQNVRLNNLHCTCVLTFHTYTLCNIQNVVERSAIPILVIYCFRSYSLGRVGS